MFTLPIPPTDELLMWGEPILAAPTEPPPQTPPPAPEVPPA
jgi:hypothetical protein